MKTTETKIDIYEINGEESGLSNEAQLTVKNHWNRKNFVILNMNDKEITVVADDLKRAIENAQNVHRY